MITLKEALSLNKEELKEENDQREEPLLKKDQQRILALLLGEITFNMLLEMSLLIQMQPRQCILTMMRLQLMEIVKL